MHSHCLSSPFLCYCRPVDTMLELQKKSQPPTDCLYISQEEAVIEATPENINLILQPRAHSGKMGLTEIRGPREKHDTLHIWGTFQVTCQREEVLGQFVIE